MRLLYPCALSNFHVIYGQNTRDQNTSDKRSKYSRSDCVLCIPVEAQTLLVTYVPCRRKSNLEIRIAGFSGHPQKMMAFKGIPGNQRHSVEKERPVLRNISTTAPLIYRIIQNRQHESSFTSRSFFRVLFSINHY